MCTGLGEHDTGMIVSIVQKHTDSLGEHDTDIVVPMVQKHSMCTGLGGHNAGMIITIHCTEAECIHVPIMLLVNPNGR